ncbi:MAG: hypothetical protein LBV29_04015, partial [Azoarcus sp.]|nr:hypothetical protein [Azoarcus sp.]
MKLTQTIAAAVLGLGFAASAQADFYSGETLSSANSTLKFTQIVEPEAEPGLFQDIYVFKVADDLLSTDGLSLYLDAYSIDRAFDREGSSFEYALSYLSVAVYRGNDVSVPAVYEWKDSWSPSYDYHPISLSGSFELDSP